MECQSTKVRWGMRGKMMFPMSLFALFMNGDKLVAGEFQGGLDSLKAHLEKGK